MTKNRLETFSDSVMAIVITLLAFELKVPLFDSVDYLETIEFLRNLAPQFFIFVLSFLTISIMWINHHYITDKIETVTYKTVWANSILLLCVSLIPFVTNFLGNNPSNQVALITYSIVMLFCSFSFSLLKTSSVDENVLTHEREVFKHVGIYAYTMAIFVGIFAPPLTYFMLVIPPLSYVLPGKRLKRI